MDQVLFVLHEGAISQWWLNRGKLSPATLKGATQLDYSAASAPQFWEWWQDDNNVGKDDIFDALFLSSLKDGFGELPDCFSAQSKEASSWKFETLSNLVNDPLFAGKALLFVKGKINRLALNSPDSDDPIKLTIQSVLDFTLPKEEPSAPPVEKNDPPVEDEKPVVEKDDATPNGIIGDCYNDPEALKLAVGTECKGTIVCVFKSTKYCYVKVEGLKEQIRFKSSGDVLFSIGDIVSLIVAMVDVADQKVVFNIVN